jgi:hypothetical protein
MLGAPTRRRTVLVGLIVTLLLVVALPAVAGGHPKANGSVTWTSAGGLEGIHTEFSLHDRPGDDVRGSGVYMTVPRDWGTEWRQITVACVTVTGNVARWGGHITATNNPAFEGDPIVGWVRDIATPGSGGDMIGTYANPPHGICGHSFTGGGTITAGNLTVKP